MQGMVTEKKNCAIKKWIKKFLKSELQCRAYKLYPHEGHLDSHFVRFFLLTSSWWNPHSPGFLYN